MVLAKGGEYHLILYEMRSNERPHLLVGWGADRSVLVYRLSEDGDRSAECRMH